MRDKLIELLMEVKREGSEPYQADYLIENNVIALPVGVNDTVYEFFDVRGFYSINEFIVENIVIGINPPKCDLYCKSKKGNIKEIFHFDSFGKTLFFSKGKAEQAKEKALKGGA